MRSDEPNDVAPAAAPDHGARASRPWHWIVASLVAGAATAVAFAPWTLSALAWLGVAVLFVAWERSSAAAALLCAFAFGIGLFGAGEYWGYPALARYGGFSTAVLVVAGTAAIVLQALQFALGALAKLVGRGTSLTLRVLVVMPAAFVLAEWIRFNTFTGWPWLALGYSQIDGPLAGFAPLLGVHGVTWAAAIVAAACALAYLDRRRWRPALAAAAAVVAAGFALGQATWTVPAGRPLRVVAVQGNITSDIKWTPAQLQPSLDLYGAETMNALARARADLVVWPETAVTARRDQVVPFLNGLADAVRPFDAAVLFGIIDIEREGEVVHYYNTAQVVGNGKGAYRKQHLVPMTEYLPGFLPEAWRRRTQEEAVGLYSPGADSQALVDVRGVPIAVSICFETAFPLLMRATSSAAALMISITNDDWFMGTTMLRQDIVIARMRALEGGRPLLRVANSGITALVEHDGKLERELPVGVKSVLRADIQPRRGATPFWRFGDVPVVILSITACLLVAAWRRRMPRVVDY